MKGVTVILFAVMVAGLLFGARENRNLVAARRTHGITQADPLVNAPPLVVFTTVALGGFRGMIADILWMRSSRLQQEGKYFELVQLADWITKLEPRFTEVWAYHAWNLAYNVSVLFPDPLDRWRWVRHGVSLLRDEGARYNPDEPRLLFELGWLFQHKIGGESDDAHLFYKQAWAAEMQELLGGERPGPDLDPARREALTTRYKLDPALMEEIDRTYGPLDWRLPQAHALYWGMRSRRVGHGVDAVFADRMVYQSMADAFRRGTLDTGPGGDRFLLRPRLELFSKTCTAYETALAHPDGGENILPAYRYFLTEAVVLSYLYDRREDASHALALLKDKEPGISGGETVEDVLFRTFAREGLDAPAPAAIQAIASLLAQARQWRQAGDPVRAEGYERVAGLLRERYRTRMDLPGLDQLRQP